MMKPWIYLSLFAAAAGFLPASAIADKYPSKPIVLISPLPVGGSTDAATRAWMACASRLAGQPFVLLNKPGANGVIAAHVMRQQPNDGYTLMVSGMSQMAITPFLFKKLPYDPEEEFEGAAVFGVTTFILVASAQSGIKSLAELQHAAKTSAKGIDFGIPAIGTPAHLLSAAVAASLNIRATMVPLSGEPAGIVALLSNQLPAMIFVLGSVTQEIMSGKLVPLVTFTESRISSLPSVPTVGEALGESSLVRYGWLGIAVKSKGPRRIINFVEEWTKKCVGQSDFSQALNNALFTPKFMDSNEYAKMLHKDIAFWASWIKRLNITNE